MKLIKASLIGLLVVTGWSAKADPGKTQLEREPPKAESSENFGHSVAPVVGYDPTFGVVVGGAYFFSAPRLNYHVDANTNFQRVYQLHMSFRHQFGEMLEIGWRGNLTKGFDPFYGQGGNTKVSDYVQIWGLNIDHRLHFGLRTSPYFMLGAFGDLRTRNEELTGPKNPGGRVAPDERTLGVGVFSRIDTRKDGVGTSAKDGFSLGAQVTYVPMALTSVPNKSFTQVEGDFIVYKQILDEVVDDVIAAFCLRGGYTIGDPTYAFNYRLGGTNTLRGLLENRLRGKKYYLQQTELRFPLLHPVGLVTFMGFGDATDNAFDNPKMTYGAGLRIGLPPDWVSQVRLDFGFSKDQWGFFANFGQVF